MAQNFKGRANRSSSSLAPFPRAPFWWKTYLSHSHMGKNQHLIVSRGGAGPSKSGLVPTKLREKHLPVTQLGLTNMGSTLPFSGATERAEHQLLAPCQPQGAGCGLWISCATPLNGGCTRETGEPPAWSKFGGCERRNWRMSVEDQCRPLRRSAN